MPESATLLKKRLQVCNFIKKETLAQVFSYEFCEISENNFVAEHLWATASAFFQNNNIYYIFNIYLNLKFLVPVRFNTLTTTVPIMWKANQLTGFYMMGILVVKVLNRSVQTSFT